MEVLVVVGCVCLVFGLFGSWISGQKGREPVEGLSLGVLFGPFGCLIEAILPSISQEDLAARAARSQQLKQDYARRVADQIQQQRAWQDQQEAVQEAARQARAARWKKLRDDNRELVGVVEAIVVGLVWALPVIALVAYYLSPLL